MLRMRCIVSYAAAYTASSQDAPIDLRYKTTNSNVLIDITFYLRRTTPQKPVLLRDCRIKFTSRLALLRYLQKHQLLQRLVYVWGISSCYVCFFFRYQCFDVR